MDRFIGLDAHASSCTLGVVSPSGKRVGSHVVETNARCLIEAVRQIPEPRHVCLEEGTLSGWLYEVLSPHAEQVVVTAVRESRGPKDEGHPREAWVDRDMEALARLTPQAKLRVLSGLIEQGWMLKEAWLRMRDPEAPPSEIRRRARRMVGEPPS